MKKTIKTIRHFSYGVLFSVVALMAQPVQSQTGENDPKFNTFDTVSAAGTNGMINSSVIQTDDKTILVGDFSVYNNQTANGIVRVNTDGTIDTEFNSGAGVNGGIKTVLVQANDKIIIAGGFTTYNNVPVNRIARLHKNGTIDKKFITEVGANGNILSIALQGSGKIIVAGEFSSYDGQAVNGLIRLNQDGTIDNTFFFPSAVNYPTRVLVQEDGKIIITGRDLNSKQYVFRLNVNGSKDNTFSYTDPIEQTNRHAVVEVMIMQGNKILIGGGIAGGVEERTGMLFRLKPNGSIDPKFEYENNYTDNVWIKSLALQQDGKIVFAGRSRIYADDNLSNNYIGRLNASGATDLTFTIHNEERDKATTANAISIQSDGKILATGYFSTVGSLLMDNIVRLNTNGDVDATFNQKTGANGSVYTSAKQEDGKLLIGGDFVTYNYETVNRIARLKKNGSLDPSFNSGTGANGTVKSIAVQPNGKIIIGGEFTSYNNEPCQQIARLNTDGTLDGSFKALGVDGVINSIVIQENEKIVIAGKFTTVNGVANKYVARLRSNGKVDPSFSSSLTDDMFDAVNVCILDQNKNLLLGGSHLGSVPSSVQNRYIVRLNPNGSIDGDFKGNCLDGVYALALQPDNKIIIGGGRIQNGIHQIDPFKGYVSRLNPDGTNDESFKLMHDYMYMDNAVRTVALLENDKIFFGGHFTTRFSNSHVSHTGLLNSDGSIDSTFTADANSNVYTSIVLNKNKMIIAGDFTMYNSTVRTGIARVSIKAEAPICRNASVDNPSSITNAASMFAFPNPASSTITVDNVVIGSKLTIRDALGKIMDAKVTNMEKANIELSNYPNGIYFLTSESNGVTATLKFIVNK